MSGRGNRGRSLSHTVMVGLLITGLAAAGCGKKQGAATTDNKNPEQVADANGPANLQNTALSVPTPGVRDRLHQSFADATRNGDNPPGEENRPPDVTMTDKPTFKILQEVQKRWDDIRFTNASGKPIHYSATLETAFGSIEIELRPELAPNHVRNFVALAQAGYYEKLLFDRIRHEESTVANDPSPLKLDLVEAGCPVGSGDPASGSVGYWLKPEFSEHEKHVEGTVGACRGFEPDSAGTRFYITLNKSAGNLDGNYTVFGRVKSGLDVVRKIAEQPVVVDDSEPNSPSRRPEKPILIQKVTIHTDAGTRSES
jgi:peptidyl-prolyl cis-trans isomerase B (cyclophilin B)